jgi:hypothetical protein
MDCSEGHRALLTIMGSSSAASGLVECSTSTTEKQREQHRLSFWTLRHPDFPQRASHAAARRWLGLAAENLLRVDAGKLRQLSDGG